MAPLHENRSFPHLKYPSLRDEGLKDGLQWLSGKAMDDGAEGLWRIQEKLYDLTDFVKKHPGGEDWLALTKGTDITEAFECHHISTYPRKMLDKFYIRDAITPRNSPFTFKDTGFYKILKARVREELKNIPTDHGRQSKRLIEGLALGTLIFSILSCYCNCAMTRVASICIAGLFLAWTTVCAHNFFHHKDNWRMYLFNLSMMTSRDWRISHALSHHLFPNTLMDLEISTFEPLFEWLPRKDKSTFSRYAPWIYSFFVYAAVFDMQFYAKCYRTLYKKGGFRGEDLVHFILPLTMFLFGGSSLVTVLVCWMAVIHVGSFFFGLIGVNAAHHHPDIFHDGDEPHEDSDWGIHQLHAVMDRVDITGSHFKVLTFFGDHALHHLFPTLDHAVLPYLYPLLHKTCKEFRTQLRMTTQMDLLLGQFKQLARNVPNKKKISLTINLYSGVKRTISPRTL